MPLSYQDLQGGGNGPVVAAGVAGALGGIEDAYREDHAAKLRELLARISVGEKVDTAKIRDSGATTRQGMRGQTQVDVQGLKNTGAATVQDKRNQGAVSVQDLRNEGALAVQDKRNEGAQSLAGVNNAARMDRLSKSVDFGMKKWSTPSANVQMQQAGADRRHATPSGNAQLAATGRAARAADDPQLPNGVRSYLATLPGKYGNDASAANAELERAMPDLQAEHPRLNPVKVRSAFNAYFPKNTPAAAWGQVASSTVGQTPVTPYTPGTRPAGRGMSSMPPRPRQSTTPVTSTPGASDDMASLTSQASDTLARYKAEADPTRKQALADQLADLRARRQALLTSGGGRQDDNDEF